MEIGLDDRIAQLIRESRATRVGLAAQRLDTSEELLIGSDLAFHPASTIKICVMMEIYRQARQGLLRLDEAVPIMNQFQSIVDGSPYSLDPKDDSEQELYERIGQALPRRELVRRMIVVSSNLATNILVEEARPDQINRFMKELGAPELKVLRGVEDKQAYRLGLNNSATARGFLTVLSKLERREILSKEDSDEMISILGQQQFNEMIPSKLPPGVRVAHKTGWTADYFHDVGIVYPPEGQAFVLCILTQGYAETEEREAHAFVASLAEAVYEHWVAS